MIQQMMMLMRIEMQMRQQALLNFEQSQDSDAERTPRLDDALALNSQLSEISSALATLIRSTPVGQRSGRRRPAHRDLPGPQRLRRADVRSAALRRLSNLSARPWREVDIVEETNDSDDEDDSCDEDEVVDMTSPAPGSVDEFIWRQLTETDAEGRSSIDTMRSSPDGMSAISSVSDIQPASYTPSVPSVHSVPSNQSLSGISDVSYMSSVPVSLSLEVSPRYVVCVNCCAQGTAAAQCSCELCAEFDSVAVVSDTADDDNDDDDDEMLLRSHHTIPHPNPSLAGNGARDATRPPWQLDVPSLLTRTESRATVCDPGLSNESVSAYHTLSTPGGLMSTSVNRHVLQPVVGQGRGFVASQTSLPAVGHEFVRSPTSPLSLLPGTSRPPHFNYAGRLRRQASEVTQRLPSEVSIRPWPLSDTNQATSFANRLTSPSGSANHRAALTSRSSGRQLPACLPPRQSSVMAAAAQRGSTYRGRNTRPSRYNASLTGDRSRTSRPQWRI